MEYRQDGRFVFCPTARGTLGVEVVAPGILRVFFGEEARNYVSKAVEADLHEACPFMVTGAGEGCAVSTPLLRLEIDPQGHTDFYDAQGRALSLSYRGERGTVDRGLTPEALAERISEYAPLGRAIADGEDAADLLEKYK